MPPLHEILSCFPRKPRKSPCISTILTTLADVLPSNLVKFVLGRRVPYRPPWQQVVGEQGSFYQVSVLVLLTHQAGSIFIV